MCGRHPGCAYKEGGKAGLFTVVICRYNQNKWDKLLYGTI